MNTEPKISVVMPVHNGEKYIKPSIESILDQTFKNFEFIIINDGSTDKTAEILENYKADERIKTIETNHIGLKNALNKGIKKANGKYIVRMDSDDISKLDRLDKQYNFMENNSEVAMVGSQAILINENGDEIEIFDYIKKEDKEIKKQLLRTCPFIHPSVMIRKSILDKVGYYKIRYAEDYELWSRIVPYYKVSNILEPLIKYRKHQNQSTAKFNLKYRSYAIYVRILVYIRMLISKFKKC